jgi:DNA-binding NarL/FixJ family response regulator
VTLKTVENHKYNLYRKCGVGGLAALFRYAVHHGLVTI